MPFEGLCKASGGVASRGGRLFHVTRKGTHDVCVRILQRDMFATLEFVLSLWTSRFPGAFFDFLVDVPPEAVDQASSSVANWQGRPMGFCHCKLYV